MALMVSNNLLSQMSIFHIVFSFLLVPNSRDGQLTVTTLWPGCRASLKFPLVTFKRRFLQCLCHSVMVCHTHGFQSDSSQSSCSVLRPEDSLLVIPSMPCFPEIPPKAHQPLRTAPYSCLSTHIHSTNPPLNQP